MFLLNVIVKADNVHRQRDRLHIQHRRNTNNNVTHYELQGYLLQKNFLSADRFLIDDDTTAQNNRDVDNF
jgi:hypothetical protein